MIELNTSDTIELFMNDLSSRERVMALRGMREEERNEFLMVLYNTKPRYARQLEFELEIKRVAERVIKHTN